MSQHDPHLQNISKSSEAVDPMTSIVHHLERIIILIKETVPKKEEKETGPNDGTPAADDEEMLPESTRKRRLKLYRAALAGDWESAKGIYNQYEEEDIRQKITTNGDTALHVAAATMRIDFVKELVKKMNEEDLVQKNEFEQTALFTAVWSGKVVLAEELMKKNKRIAMEPDKYGTLPILIAASLGHKDMVMYLYDKTKDSLKEEDWVELFISSIEADLYDVARRLLEDHRVLTTASRGNGYTALHALARKNIQNQPGIFKRYFNLGAKDVRDKRLRPALQLVERIWKDIIMLPSHKEISEKIAGPEKLIFDAAKRGNTDFLSILIRGYPDLIWKIDNRENSYSIFHYAVMYRQEAVFNIIYEIGSIKDAIFTYFADNKDNNILHLAGMLAPPNRLHIVPGPALQMQSELLWFKKVEKLVQPRLAEARNKNGYTPRELFTKEHLDLREKGEQWMNNTAGSCMVVATLIATVVFAAAFTVPGGNNGNTGFPLFVDKVSFKIFAISDAISMVSSAVSIVNFLSILTSAYAEEDFHRRLPRKLCVGLVTLFIAMAAMMVVFSTTFFIVFDYSSLLIAILVIAVASIPVIWFGKQHFKLIWNILSPNACRQQRKIKLFRKEGDSSDQSQGANKFNGRQSSCSTNV